jgi:signal transduction histidine kinase
MRQTPQPGTPAPAALGLVRAVWQRLQQATPRLVAAPDWPLVSALLLGLVALVETVVYTGGPATSDGSTALLLNLLATVPLALRHRHLPATAAIVTTATVLLLGGDVQWTVSGIAAQLWVLYLVASRYPRRVSLLLCLPFLLNALSPFGGQHAATSAVVLLVLVLASLALGDARRLRGQVIAERDQSRRVVAAAKRDQAALAERARIARELHDVVAHHVSMIAIQADTARLATPGMPEQGRERLEIIGTTARDTMTELRRLLGVLRSDSDHGGPGDSRSPQPGLDRLDELVDGARAAGTPVRLVLAGQVGRLPPGVDLTAYRIVQEALTNARRHAPGADVEIELRYTPDTLHLRVRDNGPGPAGPSDGHGLLGMRERAAMVGGVLRTGTPSGGGFVVEADLPIRLVP